METYTFDEGIGLLVLVKAPLGVIKHLQKTHNRHQLHSEIHKHLRLPRTREILRKIEPKSNEIEPKSNEIEPKSNEIEPKSNEIKPKSNEIKPKSNEIKPKSNDGSPVVSTKCEAFNGVKARNAKHSTELKHEIPQDEDPEIILTEIDIRTHKYTRYDQMPNDLTRKLYLEKEELFHEMQQNHLKMRQVPEGEDHNDERAKYRAEVLRLDVEIDKKWKLIDAEIERFMSNPERADKKADNLPHLEGVPQSGGEVATPSVKAAGEFDISTYRSYISKALRKKQLTPAQLVELQRRVDALLDAHIEIKPETLAKLKAKGVTVHL